MFTNSLPVGTGTDTVERSVISLSFSYHLAGRRNFRTAEFKSLPLGPWVHHNLCDRFATVLKPNRLEALIAPANQRHCREASNQFERP